MSAHVHTCTTPVQVSGQEETWAQRVLPGTYGAVGQGQGPGEEGLSAEDHLGRGQWPGQSPKEPKAGPQGRRARPVDGWVRTWHGGPLAAPTASELWLPLCWAPSSWLALSPQPHQAPWGRTLLRSYSASLLTKGEGWKRLVGSDPGAGAQRGHWAFLSRGAHWVTVSPKPQSP